MIYLYAGRQAEKPAFSYMKEYRQRRPADRQRRPKEYARPDQGRQEGKARQTGRRQAEHMTKKLNARQMKYCAGRAEGKSRAQAYRDAGYSPEGTQRTAEQNAYRMEVKSPAGTALRLKIEELRSRDAEHAVLTREDRLRLLSELATDEDVKPQDRIRAADQIARMCGDYTDRLQIEGSAAVTLSYADRLEAIRQSLTERP